MTLTSKYVGHIKQNKIDLLTISSFVDIVIHPPIHSSIVHVFFSGLVSRRLLPW